jgi:hypothetical protein
LSVNISEFAADSSSDSPQLQSLIPPPCTDTYSRTYSKKIVVWEYNLLPLLECIETVRTSNPMWDDAIAFQDMFSVYQAAKEYGIYGIWKTYTHIALMDGLDYDSVRVLCFSIHQDDYAVGRSVMEALPAGSVPAPAFWELDEVEDIGLGVYLAVARTCQEHQAEVLQWHPESEEVCIDGRELAKYFCWKQFFPDADIPTSD